MQGPVSKLSSAVLAHPMQHVEISAGAGMMRGHVWFISTVAAAFRPVLVAQPAAWTCPHGSRYAPQRSKLPLPRKMSATDSTVLILVYWALADRLISLPHAAELLRRPVSQVELDFRGPPVGDSASSQR